MRGRRAEAADAAHRINPWRLISSDGKASEPAAGTRTCSLTAEWRSSPGAPAASGAASPKPSGGGCLCAGERAVAGEAMGQTYEQFLDGYAQEAAIKRLNTVEEVAAVAVLLASEAGGGITGALLNVDGGTAL